MGQGNEEAELVEDTNDVKSATLDSSEEQENDNDKKDSNLSGSVTFHSVETDSLDDSSNSAMNNQDNNFVNIGTDEDVADNVDTSIDTTAFEEQMVLNDDDAVTKVGTSTDCIGTWSEWAKCSQSCGGGARYRTFVIIQMDDNNGVKCSAGDGDTDVKRGSEYHCSLHECPSNHAESTTHSVPADCVGAWTEWSKCSVTCAKNDEFGEQTRNFAIELLPENGGTSCPSDVQQRPCYPTPVTCKSPQISIVQSKIAQQSQTTTLLPEKPPHITTTTSSTAVSVNLHQLLDITKSFCSIILESTCSGHKSMGTFAKQISRLADDNGIFGAMSLGGPSAAADISGCEFWRSFCEGTSIADATCLKQQQDQSAMCLPSRASEMPSNCIAAAVIDCANAKSIENSAGSLGSVPGGHDLPAHDEALEKVCEVCSLDALALTPKDRDDNSTLKCARGLKQHIEKICNDKATLLANIADDYASLLLSDVALGKKGSDTAVSGGITIAQSCELQSSFCSNHGISRPYTAQKALDSEVLACYCECIDGWSGEDCEVSEATMLSAYNVIGGAGVLVLLMCAYVLY